MFKSRTFCTAKVVCVYLWFGAASLHNAAEILHGHCPRLGCMQKCWSTMNASKQVGFRVRSFLNVGLDKKKCRCVCNFLRYLQSTTARPLKICHTIYFRVPSCFSSSMLCLLLPWKYSECSHLSVLFCHAQCVNHSTLTQNSFAFFCHNLPYRVAS